MAVLKWALVALLAASVLLVLAGQLGLLQGRMPVDLGVKQGRLKAPSDTPNSVSSQAELWAGHPQLAYARVAPLAALGDGPATLARIQAVVSAMPRSQVVASGPDYLYATFSTPWMKFTDDVEFWWDPATQVVQVRSASRLGRKDFGVNRARVEAIRQSLSGR